MPTAKIVADGIAGFAGLATLYQIDPPIQGTDHIIVYHRPRIYGQPGQMTVVLSTPDGGVYGREVRAQPGTYTTDEPNHYLALQLAGGYSLVGPGAENPPESDMFDPAAHTVTEVNDYLNNADPAEQARVLEAERAGKARKGILGGN
ncbi:hypothetical protein SAMN04490240_4052 [Rhodococcus pyridinivorans]|nr:hypothetical protein SAMN04490240_4052 [Rhodococcus pyridinivorans]